MASCLQPLSVQNGVETERQKYKLKTASIGRKNGEPVSAPVNEVLATAVILCACYCALLEAPAFAKFRQFPKASNP